MKRRFIGLAATVVALAMVFMGCQPEVEHAHTFSTEWSFDKDSHWHDATCGHEEKSSLGSHIFSDWKTVVEPTEDKDGSKEGTCSTCGYKKTEKIYALGHHHNLMSEWSSDETNHWHVYDCGVDGHIDGKATHTEDSGTVTKEPTCTEKGTKIYKCTVCKRELRTGDVVAKGHSYSWINTDSKKHWKVCSECGEKDAEANHNFIHKGNCWQECECGKKIPVSLDTLGTYDPINMTFGVYPQTLKADDVTIDMSVRNWDYNFEVSAGIYLGSDGAWYNSDGKKYYKVEPIEWEYLEETKCLLSKKILSAGHVWDGNKKYKYADSSIRSRINGVFFTTAFTSNQREMIKPTTVDNSAASTIDAGNNLSPAATKYLSENTQDKIFLLSEKEVTSSGNGFAAYNAKGPGNSRIKYPTDYALYLGCSKDSDSAYGGSWWLRSPAASSFDEPNARFVRYDGDCNTIGSMDYAYNKTIGIVPALSLYEY